MKNLRFLLPVFCILILFNIWVWNKSEAKANDIMTVSFLDVGQGDAILVTAPNGRQVLIDSGRDTAILTALGSVMAVGDKSIDVTIMTHPDADHIGGYEFVLPRYEIHNIITNGRDSESALFDTVSDLNKKETPNIYKALRGMQVILDSERNIHLDVVFPATDTAPTRESNDLSVVTRLVYGDREFLLTGDATMFSESDMLRWCPECLASDVLKVGHHGSKTSSGPSFISAVRPAYSIISAGKDNSYGHPYPGVVNTLTKASSTILSTYELGNITFETDGKGLRLR